MLTAESGEVAQDLTDNPAQNTLLATIVVSLVAFLLAGTLVVEFEQGALGANIVSADDGIWWAFVTITTVGYGDYHPVTRGGRFLAAILMSVGVGVFGVLTSYLARSFLRHSEEQASDELAAIRAEMGELRRLLEERDAQPRPEHAARGASAESGPVVENGGEKGL